MIQGLHFDVGSDELSAVLQTRIDQCEKKVVMFEAQAKKQAELTKELGSEDAEMPKFSGDQATNLQAKADEYKQKKKEYEFLRDHIIKGETYRLDRSDLNYLGIVKSRY